MRRIRFLDYVDLGAGQADQQVRDFYGTNGNGKPLVIRIAASHSGKVTRNNGFYLPSEMKVGTETWTAQFNKPILTHHDDHEDAVGRVLSSRYVDLSNSVRGGQDSVASLHDALKMSDELLTSFLDGKMNHDQMVDVANQYFIQNNAMLEDPNYRGLGYTEIVAAITDPDAIAKVLDGRYLTGSIGASTNRAVCSICKTDWAGEDGPCDHRPGKEYDGKRAVLIAGQLFYDEWSFVNKPADRHSRVIEVNVNGISDFVEVEGVPATDKVQDSVPSITLAPVQNISVVVDSPVADATVEPAAAVVESDPLKDFWGDSFDSLIGDDPWGRDYAEMFMNAVQEEKDEIKAAELRNATLSAEKRKALSSSTFCGPDRSFPVPDCAHVTAARRLIGKYKGPGDKQKILACVSRKAARLGCGGKDEVIGVGDFVLDYFDHMNDLEVQQLHNGVLASLRERGLMTSCEALAAALEAERAADTATPDPKLDELTSQLSVVQTELQAAYADMTKLQEQLTTSAQRYRKVVEGRICDLKQLTGNFDEKAFLDTLQDKPLEYLENLLLETSNGVDLKNARDILVSGVADISKTEPVADPTLKIAEETPGQLPTQQISEEDMVKREYLRLCRIDKKLADRFLASVQRTK